MRIFPAIDLLEGKVVRLIRGDYSRQTVYSDKPEQTACEWEKQGAEWLHVVDLDGAQSGEIGNRAGLLTIRRQTRCKIQFGGGLRTLAVIQSVLDDGIDRIVLGTRAVEETFLRGALERFGDKIAVGLDIRNGNVQTQGWLTGNEQTSEKAIELFNRYPIRTIIYTDIQRDGMLAGPNWDGLAKILGLTKANVILSGGVSTLADVQKAARIENRNFEGLIIGKALYSGKITLGEAIQLTRQGRRQVP